MAGEGPRLTPPLVEARARRPDSRSGAPRADLRDGREGQSRARSGEDADRLCREPVDGRDLYGRRPGQPRPGRGAAARLSRSRRVSARSSSASRTMTFDYLSGQIEAGAEAVQLFDSWAGSLAPAAVRTLGDRADRAARRGAARRAIPNVPVIGFPKGAGGKLARLCARNRSRCARARRDGRSGLGGEANCPSGLPVQGNLDPLALLAGGEALKRRGRRASLTHSPGGLTSSISGTASCRTRRSRMSSSCLPLVKGGK